MPAPQIKAEDFIIEQDLALGEGGQKTKFRNNVAAIRLLDDLERSGRQATADEQRVLAKYVGWGGIPQAFDPNNADWSREHAELKALMTPEQFADAMRSTRYAHYTSREIIVDGIYAALRRFGFTGGKTLEAGAGVGNFLGLMPADMRSAGRFTAIEREPFSSAIARQLYPLQNVQRADFTEFKGNDAYFDAAVGNPPFASDPQTDRSGRKHLSGLSLHNYFFAKAVDMLRDGGIMAQVVTNSFMDAKNDTARRYIGERARFLGAIRLPNSAFVKNANTEVTTDIIFLQKLPDSEIGGKAAKADAKRWRSTGVYTDRTGKEVALNQYFIDNPHMMLGDYGAFGTMYGPDQPALVARPGQDTLAMLKEAVANLPQGVYQSIADTGTSDQTNAAIIALKDVPVKEGGYYVDGDRLIQRLQDLAGEPRGTEITPQTQWTEKTKLGDAGYARIKALAHMRGTVRSLIAAEMSDKTKDMEELRSKLNEQYDAYVAEFGLINDRSTLRVFEDDPDFPLLASLEHGYTPGIGIAVAKKMGVKPMKATARKGPIFTQRVVAARQQVRTVKNASDALDVSMAERGKLDAGYIGQLLGKDADQVLRDLSGGDNPLLFMDPASNEYVLRDAYLSGNVRQKLAQAREAGLFGNVSALERVQPPDVPAHEISARLGSPWIPTEVYRDFALAHFGDGAKVAVGYLKANSSYQLAVYGGSDVAMHNTWGTREKPADELMSALMNNRTVKVTYRDSEGKTHTDAEATERANTKAQELRERFGDWLFSDPDRSELLAKAYNETNNNYVTRVYDGSHMTFPGKVPDAIIRFRRHQRNAIARIVQDRTALLDHVVGAGKTFTIVAGAMELKRTGLARKPMVAVPNHLVKQWAADFYRLYPGANILTATKKDFERANRRKFLAKIATGDWDAVVIAHSSFGFIKPAPEFEAQFNANQVAEIVATINSVEEDDSGDKPAKKRTIKQLEAMKERLENRIRALRDKPMDDLLDFEQIGVDQLFVDEAHLFKNLMYSTKMQGVSGMQDPSGSQRAYDMYVKTQQIYAKNGRGQGVVFATGTPISNSLAEMYHMMRYLMPDQIKAMGFDSFDAWANTFAAVDQVWMQAPSGDGFKASNRMGTFVNTPELLKLFDQVCDTVTMDDIKKAFSEENNGAEFPLPKLKTGRRIPVSMDKSPAQEAYMQEIAARAKAIESRKGPPKKGDDNLLVVMGDARKAAMDIRMVDPDVTQREIGGRIDVAANNAFERYLKYADVKGTQIIFSDLGTPLKHAQAELKEYEALQARIAAGTEDVAASATLGDEVAIGIMEDVEAAQAEMESNGPDWLVAVRAALRGFSVYDDFKAALVEKGVPPDEIAFIHDYNTDDQKASLFRKVNAGQIRFLIGSTAKLGAGTNVQERLVAEHHLDVPWRPSDVEQREGRIIRQGNKLMDEVPGFEIEILAYVTRDTLDMRMWQVQENKLRMINQLRTRQISREIDNAFEDMEMSAGEMQAAATGDINLLKEIQLRNDVKKLEVKRRSFEGQRNDLITRRRRAAEKLERLPRELEEARRIAKYAEAYLSDLENNSPPFTMVIDGKEFTDIQDAKNHLRELTDKREQVVKDGVAQVEDDGTPVTRAAPISVTINGEVFKNRNTIAEVFSDAAGDYQDPIKWTVNGQDYRRRVKLANAIRQQVVDAIADESEKSIGQFAGFDVTVEGMVDKRGDTVLDVALSVGGSVMISGQRVIGDTARAPDTVISTAENLVKRPISQARYLERDIVQAKREAEDLAKAKSLDKWPDEEKLNAARAAHKAVLDLLKKKEESAKPAPDDDAAFARGNPFYSALTSELSSVNAAAQPALGWANTINGLVKAGKVKQDEVTWSGVLDWLKLQEGKVTREQLVQFLDANGVRVEETVLAGPGFFKDVDEAIDYVAERYAMTPEEVREEYGYSDEQDYIELAKSVVDDRPDATKYGTYQLPGGTNYREILLTLPVKTPKVYRVSAAGGPVAELPDVADFATREEAQAELGRRQAAQPRLYHSMMEFDRLARDGGPYRSGHWDQPNVLAHIRVNDRTDADGKRVLFIEEIQSDWGQEGKKKGFAPAEPADFTVDVKLVGSWHPQFPDQRDKWRVTVNGRDRGYIQAADENEARYKATANEHNRRDNSGKPPTAPFVTKTDAWLSLALKRIVKMAVDEGYDRVAFVNGEQSAERYDLSKQVDEIRHLKQADGTYDLAITPAGGRSMMTLNGKSLSGLSESDLEEIVGKEVAKKIVAEEGPRGGDRFHKLTGLDLKVGGEGMKAFYDKIVPATVKEVLRKLSVGAHSSSGKTVLPKVNGNRGLVNAEAVRNLALSEPFKNKGFEGLSADAKGLVKGHMLALSQHPQILKAIVGAVPVDVVNVLRAKQLSPEMFFHDPAMLVDDLAAKLGPDMAARIDVPTALVKAIASVAAELPTVLGGTDGMASEERGSALGTGVHKEILGQIDVLGVGKQPGFTITPAMQERAADGLPLFDRSTGALRAVLQSMTGQGMTVEQVQAIVQPMAAKWDVDVRVVALPADLPIKAPSDAMGLHYNGVIYIVAWTNRSQAKVLRTLAHETIAHYGLRSMLGRENWRAFMRQIQFAARRKGGPLQEISDYIRRTYVDENGQFNLSEVQEGDEIAARVVELGVDPSTGEFRPGFGMLKAVFARVAEFLRGLGFTIEFTNLELQGMLVRSQRALARRSGRPVAVSGVAAARGGVRADVNRMTSEQMQAEIRSLIPRVEQAYEDGNQPLAERLDARLETLMENLEANYLETEEDRLTAVDMLNPMSAARVADGEQGDTEADLVRDLANTWKEMSTGFGWGNQNLSDAEKAAQLRGMVDDYAYRHGGIKPGVTDQQILDAAEDAFQSVYGMRAQQLERIRQRNRPPLTEYRPDDPTPEQLAAQYQAMAAAGDASLAALRERQALAGNSENDQTPIPDWMRTAQFRRGPDLAAASRSASNTAAHYRSMGLQALGRRQITELYGNILPQLPIYNRLMAQMDADKNEVGAQADQIAKDWGNLKDERELAELMHDATLAQMDPEKPLMRGDDPFTYDGLRAKFVALSPEARQVYVQAREAYREHHENVRQAIRDRIERSELRGQRKAELLQQMDSEFYKAIKGVYFPLARFGDYVVIVRDPTGKVLSVNRAETLNEAEALQASLRQSYPGMTVGKVLKSKEFNAGRDAVGRGFMQNLYEALGRTDMDDMQRGELEDMLGQLYLSALPDLSWAKHGIHRKGTPGFSQDARRAFAQNTFHGARYLAKVRYSDLLENELIDAQKQVDALADSDSYDSVKAQQVIDEMVKRHDAAMNPNGNALSTALTSVGFVFHLGLSPASAMVNLTQTALVALPLMGSKWGFSKSTAALLKASQQAASNGNDISKVLSTEERRAFDEAVRSGVIDVTMAHDLAGISQGEDAKVAWKMRPVMRWASFLFHHAEKFNRQVTFVAAYRLAREAGTSVKQAYEQAVKATYDGHFDYSASNRPRIMQGNVAKVVLLFKQYGQNMVYTLSRQAYLAMKGRNPYERAQARRALGGLLAMHGAAAGVLGLPMVSTLLAAASFLGGDDDEPWDAEVALRNMLADALGDQAADVLARGLSRLTPWDISGRVGLDKLILPDIQEGLEGQDLANSAMAAALGPVAGIAVSAARGMQEIAGGNWARGLEAMAPSLARGPLKALRYGTEGAIDKTGKPIVEDVGAAGVIGQALGFSPSEVRLATEAKSAVHQADARLAKRRADLMRHYAMAVIQGDQEGAQDALADIRAFNEKNPGRRINPLQMAKSVAMRRKQIAQSEGGVYLPRSRRDAMQAGEFGMP